MLPWSVQGGNQKGFGLGCDDTVIQILDSSAQ